MSQKPEIIWPDYYNPKNSAVHVSNHLKIDAQQELIWAWLVRAVLWPDWYVNSGNVEFLEGETPDLNMNTRFRWKTLASLLNRPYLNTSRMNELRGMRMVWVLAGTMPG